MNYAPDLTPAFFNHVAQVAERLADSSQDPREVEAHILCVMMSESGVHASARNPLSDASGLIQFMPDTLVRLHWASGPENFRTLTAEQQLQYVESYFWPHRGQIVSTAAAYTATFLPADIEHASDPNFVLVAKGGRRGWAFAMNAAFDANHDARITVGELDKAIERQCRGPRWEEIVDLSGIPWEVVAHVPFDLFTTLGIQEALQALGYSPGQLDGIPGQRTRGAVLQYQTDMGLKVDGLVGSRTRASLDARLRTTGLLDPSSPPPAPP